MTYEKRYALRTGTQRMELVWIEPPTTGTHRGKVRNPDGRGGKFRPLHGQQGYTMDFKKMDTIANTISSGGSVLDLIKAIDIDIPDELD